MLRKSPSEVILEIGPDKQAGFERTQGMKESNKQAPFAFKGLMNDDFTADRLFPVDEIGVPLPIYVPNNELTDKTDRHHHFATRRRYNKELGDIGKALRASRIQKVPIKLHKLFNVHFDDTPVPSDVTSRFGLLLLMTAGYLPEKAIDVRRSNPRERTLEKSERQAIWAGNLIRLDAMNTVHDFIRDYIVQKGIRQFTESDVDEFLHSRDPDKIRNIGKELISVVASTSTEPIKQVYIDAWKAGLLPRQDYRSDYKSKYKVKAVPKKPARFVLNHVLGVDMLIPNVRKVLGKRFDVGLTSVG